MFSPNARKLIVGAVIAGAVALMFSALGVVAERIERVPLAEQRLDSIERTLIAVDEKLDRLLEGNR